MRQRGFFDVERRLEAISANGDPLETIKKIVRWEDFRADIEAVTETKPEERKSNAGSVVALQYHLVCSISVGPPYLHVRMLRNQRGENLTETLCNRMPDAALKA
jgi:hypothetical protein